MDYIDPYSDSTRQDDETPLFIAGEILDFERQEMEDVVVEKRATRLSVDDIDEAKEEAFPSSNNMEVESEPQTQPSMPSPPSFH